ncbi:MAG: hypothetical protein ACE5GB_13075 [Acidimicrobiales bacterium]
MHDSPAGVADPPAPARTDPGELDLRDHRAPPVAAGQSGEVSNLPPPPTSPDPAAPAPPAGGEITLASLAYRLFETVEHQLARGPYADTLNTITALTDRIESIEHRLEAPHPHSGAIAALTELQEGLDRQLTTLTERTDQVEHRLDTPDPHVAALGALGDRIEILEHRLDAPHPHTAMIANLGDRLDSVERLGAPHTIGAITERLDAIESALASGDTLEIERRLDAIETRIGEPQGAGGLEQRLGALEAQILATPATINALGHRLDAVEMQQLESELGSGPGRLVPRLLVLVALAIVVATLIVAVVTSRDDGGQGAIGGVGADRAEVLGGP